MLSLPPQEQFRFQVALVQHRITRYRVPFLIGLRNALRAVGGTLIVVYSTNERVEEDRGDGGQIPWGVLVRAHRARLFGRDIVVQHLPWALLARCDLVVLPHEMSVLSTTSLSLLFLAGRKRFAFWGHGRNFQSEHNVWIAEAIKAFLARRASWWFGYTELSVGELLKCGVERSRITCLQNSALRQGEVDLLGARKGCTDATRAPLIIFLGSLSKAKRLDLFVQSMELLKQSCPELTVEVIGDGPDRDSVKSASREYPWFKWRGALWSDDKNEVLVRASLAVIPGMIGLPLMECFAAGVPVITCENSPHSPEIAYLENGKNGVMVTDTALAIASAASTLLNDSSSLAIMRGKCVETARNLSIESMVARFASGIDDAIGRKGLASAPVDESSINLDTARETIVVMWQRFLPYHVARIEALARWCVKTGHSLYAIEVAAHEQTYPFIEQARFSEVINHVRVIEVTNYNNMSAVEIGREVYKTLQRLQPTVILCPATPFPEGMAALRFRAKSMCRVFIMDDAWEATDHRPWFVRQAKKIIHENVDGVFMPSSSHSSYFASLGIPPTRQAVGVNAVDNEYFGRAAASVGRQSVSEKGQRYFLFVGRLISKKGISVLLEAYAKFARGAGTNNPHRLKVVGDGALAYEVKNSAERDDRIEVMGPRGQAELSQLLARSTAVIVPSLEDQWGLVINEAMASGCCVIASIGAGASALIEHGVSGFRVEAGSVEALANAMTLVSGMSDEALHEIGRSAQRRVGQFGTERFVSGVSTLLDIPRRMNATFASDLAVALWRGHVAIR